MALNPFAVPKRRRGVSVPQRRADGVQHRDDQANNDTAASSPTPVPMIDLITPPPTPHSRQMRPPFNTPDTAEVFHTMGSTSLVEEHTIQKQVASWDTRVIQSQERFEANFKCIIIMFIAQIGALGMIGVALHTHGVHVRIHVAHMSILTALVMYFVAVAACLWKLM